MSTPILTTRVVVDRDVFGSRHRGVDRLVRVRGIVSALTCPVCGSEIDASGPGVASHHPDYDPSRGWASPWVPFVEDLRGSPPVESARVVYRWLGDRVVVDEDAVTA